MHAGKWMYKARKFEQQFNAIKLAYFYGLAFTFEGFCKHTGFKQNRHTRDTLSQLVQAGVLTKEKRLFNDGHYRMMYRGITNWEREQLHLIPLRNGVIIRQSAETQ